MKTKDKQNLQTRWLNKSVGEAMEGGWETLKNRIEIIQSQFVDFFFKKKHFQTAWETWNSTQLSSKYSENFEFDDVFFL